jgi:protein-tyrosine phosphatase
MSYVDLHCHLLPAVDDGAQTLDESVRHARRMVAEGVRDVLVTPHVNRIWSLEVASIPDRMGELRAALRAEGVQLRVHDGAELAHTRVADSRDRELATIAAGPPSGRWLLLETPFSGVGTSFLAAAAELRARGFGLLLAHPERAPDIEHGGLERLRPLLGAGALLQVNVCSLLGQHGLAVQESAVGLLRSGLAHVLASDGHPGTREHTLQLGFHLALRAGASSTQAWRLTQGNPRFLLRHGIPPSPSGVPLAGLAAAS